MYKTDGVLGFYGGVRGMVVGQALIKSVVFASNDWAVSLCGSAPFLGRVTSLILAAMFSGLVTSFIVTPVERVKIILQGKGNARGENELTVLRSMLREEGGLKNLLSVGLWPTISREVPSYAIYFVTFRLLKDLGLPTVLAGGAAGVACWVPVYPIDVVKTTLQEDESYNRRSAWEVLGTIVKEEGVGGLFDGLTPKVIRACINHAVTFTVYSSLTGT